MMTKDSALTTKPVLPGKAKITNVVQNDTRQAKRIFEESLSKTARQLMKSDEKISGDPAPAAVSFASPQMVGSTTVHAPASGAIDPQMTAHLARISAAIAEVAASGATAEVHLTLPKGATAIDGAIIGRNNSGALHIILTAHDAIAPAQAAMLQASLHDRLRQRDIRVGKIALKKVEFRGA